MTEVRYCNREIVVVCKHMIVERSNSIIHRVHESH
jgi:hypothetical protein